MAAAKASRYFSAAHAQAQKKVNDYALFRGKMLMGHGGLLLVGLLLALQTLPETHCVLLSFTAPPGWCVLN
jgi:hypothetical protein